MTLDELSQIADANGLQLDRAQLDLLDRYALVLRETNANVNLISRKDEENIVEKHILHSLTLVMPDVIGYNIPEGAQVFDIGTGGGLPGIPLAIVRPDLHITLCDSIAKKIAAVEKMTSALGLINIQTVVSRAEDISKKEPNKKKFSIVVSRAVAPLDDIVKWTKDLLVPHGVLLSLKGGALSEELRRTERLNFVESVKSNPLRLDGYDGFLKEEKQAVVVRLK